MRRNRWEPLTQLRCFQNFLHARNGKWIETDGNLKVQDQNCMLGVVAVRFLPIPEFLSWLFMQYGSYIVLLQENSIYVNQWWVSPSQNFMNSFQLLKIKIRIDCMPVWNKFPVNHTKIPPDARHYFGAEPIYFNDNFGRLTGLSVCSKLCSSCIFPSA